MRTLAGKVCDVCGGESAGVAGSALGGFSFAYCSGCLTAGAEPFDVLAVTVEMAGGLDSCAEWVNQVLEGTLSRTGKSREEFEAMVEEVRNEQG